MRSQDRLTVSLAIGVSIVAAAPALAGTDEAATPHGVHASAQSTPSDTTPEAEHPRWRIADVDLETQRVLLEDQPLTLHASEPLHGKGVTFFSQSFAREIMVMFDGEPIVLRRTHAPEATGLHFETDNFIADEDGYVTMGAEATIHVNEANGLLLTLSTPDEPAYRVAMTIEGVIDSEAVVCRCVIKPTEYYLGCSKQNCELYTRCTHGAKRGRCDFVPKRGTQSKVPVLDPNAP